MEAIILCGGLGTRLRSIVPDVPKTLAPVNDRPFMTYLMDHWIAQGVKHFIFAVGYKYELIQHYFGDHYHSIPISYSIERKPLGTGGALTQALSHTSKSHVLALNGDTYFPIRLDSLKQFSDAAITLALYKVQENNRYGGMKIDNQYYISDIHTDSNLINAGIYWINKIKFLECDFDMTHQVSLEKDVLPEFISKGLCRGYIYNEYFIDIGIPNDYSRFVSNVNRSEICLNEF